MGKSIDSYFAKFSALQEPEELRGRRQPSTPPRPDEIGVTSVYPLPSEATQYALIGRVVAEWSSLESAVDLIIWVLCGSDIEIFACVTAQLIGFGPRFSALTSIAGRRKASAALMDRLNEFKSFAQGVSEQRNRIVHDSWGTISDENGKRTVVKKTLTARGELKFSVDPFTDEDFLRLIYKVQRLTDIFEFILAIQVLEECRV